MAVEWILWHYTPNLVAAIIFAVSFGLLSAVHLFRIVQTRAKFCIPFVVGGIFETIGYGARAAAHYNMKSAFPYAIQSLLILLGPILFAASIYMILGRIIRTVQAEQHSLIPLKWLTKTFVISDVTCFIIQAAGGGILSSAKSQSTINLGNYVILAGLIIQILIFGFFVAVAGVFHSRMRQKSMLSGSSDLIPWQRYLYILYSVSALISIRNVYRVIEYAWGQNGYLLQHEWSLFVFDGLLMVLVLAVSVVWYSAGINGRPQNVQDIEKEVRSETFTTKGTNVR